MGRFSSGNGVGVKDHGISLNYETQGTPPGEAEEGVRRDRSTPAGPFVDVDKTPGKEVLRNLLE